MITSQIRAVRLPKVLWNAIDELADREGCTRNGIVRIVMTRAVENARIRDNDTVEIGREG